jgi:DNA-binding NtrC family response regulator
MERELASIASQMHKGGIFYAEAVREFSKVFVATVLRENDGNQSKAARVLRVHRNTLSRMASGFGLDIRALRPGSRRLPQRLKAVGSSSQQTGKWGQKKTG